MASKRSFEDGVRLAHAKLLEAYDSRILVARMGGNSDLSDILINLKRFLPSVEQIIEAENAKAKS